MERLTGCSDWNSERRAQDDDANMTDIQRKDENFAWHALKHLSVVKEKQREYNRGIIFESK